MTLVVAQEERAKAEAAAWLARLQAQPDAGEAGEAEALAFEAWLEASPANRTAYRDALALWHEFEACAGDVAAELAEASRREASRPATLRPGVSRRWMFGAGGMAAAAAVAVAVLPGVLAQTSVQSFATGKGERRRVTLADGSTIDISAETRLQVTYSGSARQVVLADGEAIFDVVHDKARPFTVAAAGREVRVLGTQFDVRSRGGMLSVTVARGKVQVRPLSAGATARAFTLTPGQRLEIAAGGLERVNLVDPQEAFSWRAGRLVYRGQPLSQVVADLNHQYVEQVEVTDPELARMPITGVIVLDDQAAVMARLSLMLPIRSVPSDRGLLLLRK